MRVRDQQFADPEGGRTFTARFLLALVLIVVGIAYIAFTYVKVRTGDINVDGNPTYSGFGPLGDLNRWNYVIGFGLFFLGLVVAANPATPLGRGRGVVVGMLGCFLLGLAWICVYYVFTNTTHADAIWVFNDLGQYNLVVGIGFMAVGFTFATRWE